MAKNLLRRLGIVAGLVLSIVGCPDRAYSKTNNLVFGYTQKEIYNRKDILGEYTKSKKEEMKWRLEKEMRIARIIAPHNENAFVPLTFFSLKF